MITGGSMNLLLDNHTVPFSTLSTTINYCQELLAGKQSGVTVIFNVLNKFDIGGLHTCSRVDYPPCACWMSPSKVSSPWLAVPGQLWPEPLILRLFLSVGLWTAVFLLMFGIFWPLPRQPKNQQPQNMSKDTAKTTQVSARLGAESIVTTHRDRTSINNTSANYSHDCRFVGNDKGSNEINLLNWVPVCIWVTKTDI